MQKSSDYQNLKNYFAAILKFENYAFVWTSELLKQKLILLQVYSVKFILP